MQSNLERHPFLFFKTIFILQLRLTRNMTSVSRGQHSDQTPHNSQSDHPSKSSSHPAPREGSGQPFSIRVVKTHITYLMGMEKPKPSQSSLFLRIVFQICTFSDERSVISWPEAQNALGLLSPTV